MEKVSNSDGLEACAETDFILTALESKLYLDPLKLNSTLFSQKIEAKENIPANLHDLNTHVLNFTSWFNDVYRRSLLQTKKEESNQTAVYLLLHLKKSIHYALDKICKSSNTADRKYFCCVCNAAIIIKPLSDVWEALQSHEHFEELYLRLVNNGSMLMPLDGSPSRTDKQTITINNELAIMHPEELLSGTHKQEMNVNNELTLMHLNRLPSRTSKQTNIDNKQVLINSPSKKKKKVNHSYDVRTHTRLIKNEVLTEQPSLTKSAGYTPPKSSTVHVPVQLQKNQRSASSSSTNTVSDLCLTPKSSSFSPQVSSLSDTSQGNGNSTDEVSEKLRASSMNENGLGLNSFKFNFELTYHEDITQLIYPESIMLSVRRLDRLKHFSVQRTGPCRCVCLVCSCELKHPQPFSKVDKNIIMVHICGQKHLKNALTSEISSALKSYHEHFIGQELVDQSQSVYFMPASDTMAKCILCSGYMLYTDFREHIDTAKHKEKIVEVATKALKAKGPKVIAQDILDIQLKYYNVALSPPKGRRSREKGVANKNIVKNAEKAVNPQAQTETKIKTKHNVIKSVKNPAGSELVDVLPNRHLQHVQFLNKIGAVSSCKACSCDVGSTQADLIAHIRNAQHLAMTKVPLPRYSYYCEICNITFANEILWDKHFDHNVDKHLNMADSRKSKVTEYECTVCKLVFFGDDISVLRHASRGQTRSKVKKELTLPDEVKKLFNTRQAITEKGKSLREEANKVLDNKDATFVCCKVLEQILSEFYPRCKAYPFGSRISGFGNRDSDLDVFVDTGDMYLGQNNQDSHSQISFVNKSKALFSRYINEFDQIVAIPSARTPIVKLLHIRTDLECDISFRHGLSVENTKFLKYCIKLQPMLQQLVLLIKKWSAFCKLNEDITTYAFAMMAIFFMQVEEYLPSVILIRNMNPTRSKNIDGWEAFDDSLSPDILISQGVIKQCNLDLADLLKGFFKYYASFNYKVNVVCPLLGKTIEKRLFTLDGYLLPKTMSTYIRKLNNDEDSEIFRSRSEFCIQDPFDLAHNLTKACSESIINKLKNLSALACAHLEALG